MNREQAKQALRDGQRLTHVYFTSNEWVEGAGFEQYRFEDGCLCDSDEFWRWRQDESFNKGWSVIPEGQGAK